MRTYIIKSFCTVNDFQSAVTEVKEHHWFKTDIQAYGKDNKIMIELSGFDYYRAVRSCASKSEYTIDLYCWGKKSELNVEGWKIPSSFRGNTYVSKDGSIHYSKLYFSAFNPRGKRVQIEFVVKDMDVVKLFWETIHKLATCYLDDDREEIYYNAYMFENLSRSPGFRIGIDF